jgi:hypothetical protein
VRSDDGPASERSLDAELSCHALVDVSTEGEMITNLALPECAIGLVCYCRLCQSQRKRGCLRGEEGQTRSWQRTGGPGDGDGCDTGGMSFEMDLKGIGESLVRADGAPKRATDEEKQESDGL